MTKLLAGLVLLCSVAAACTSSDTTAAPEPVTDSEPTQAAESTTTTTAPEPEPPATTAPEPEPADTTTTTTAPEPADTDETDEPAEPEPADTEETAEPEPDAPPTTTQPPTTTTTPEPEPEPDAPPTTTTTTVPDPVVDQLPADPEAAAADWVAGVNAAGWGFHRHLEGNAVSSPMSIGMAFSMSRAGASADSAAALDEIFGFPEAGTHQAANAVDLSLAKASVEPNTLEVANRLFPDDQFSSRPEFSHTAATQYGATVEPVDTADGAAAADTVNRWVSERTRGLIPTIVDAGTVQDQKLVLVNTVYLKADWIVPFQAELTSDGPFTTGDGQTVTVPFMSDGNPVERRYVQLDEADAVELPYVGRELAMWLIVPHDPGGLAAVEESLDAAALTGLPRAARWLVPNSRNGGIAVTKPQVSDLRIVANCHLTPAT